MLRAALGPDQLFFFASVFCFGTFAVLIYRLEFEVLLGSHSLKRLVLPNILTHSSLLIGIYQSVSLLTQGRSLNVSGHI